MELLVKQLVCDIEPHGVAYVFLIDPERDDKEYKNKDPQTDGGRGAAELCKALSNTENKPYSTLEV